MPKVLISAIWMCAIELQPVKNGSIVADTTNFDATLQKVMKIQRIIRTSDKEQRLETGVVQVDNDLPGIYINGDDAVRMAHTIETVLEDSVGNETTFTLMLHVYATLLKSCIADNEDITE